MENTATEKKVTVYVTYWAMTQYQGSIECSPERAAELKKADGGDLHEFRGPHEDRELAGSIISIASEWLDRKPTIEDIEVEITAQ